MIAVMQPGATAEDVEHVVEVLRLHSLKAQISKGEERTVIGVIGTDSRTICSKPWKYCQVWTASRALPGPTTRQSRLQTHGHRGQRGCTTHRRARVRGHGGSMLGGKPRAARDHSSRRGCPGATCAWRGIQTPHLAIRFPGAGEDGLNLLEEGRAHGLPIITEVMEPARLSALPRPRTCCKLVPRNMQNFPLLKEIGRTDTPCMLKRGLSATIEEWLMAAEYIMYAGNPNVILCERGIRTFETATRNTLDLSAIPLIKRLSHLPIIADPSHGTGHRYLVQPMALAAAAAGADGLIIEVHPEPETALSDGPQSLTLEDFAELMTTLEQVLSRSAARWHGRARMPVSSGSRSPRCDVATGSDRSVREPGKRSMGLCACRATSRSRIVPGSSTHWATAARRLPTSRRARTVARRSRACAASASTSSATATESSCTAAACADSSKLPTCWTAELRHQHAPVERHAGRGGVFSVLSGDGSLRRRPMARIVEPLRQAGAHIDGATAAVCHRWRLLPSLHCGASSTGHRSPAPRSNPRCSCRGCSLTDPHAWSSGRRRAIIPSDCCERWAHRSRRPGWPSPCSRPIVCGASTSVVPGDFSSAAFWLVLGVLHPSAELRIENVGLNPTRTGLLTILANMGANVERLNERDVAGEPVADLVARSSDLHGTRVDGELVPLAIDEISLVALLGLFADGETVVADASELRGKESDRLAVVADGLAALGGDITATDDGWRMRRSKLRRAADSQGDHRMAMLFALRRCHRRRRRDRRRGERRHLVPQLLVRPGTPHPIMSHRWACLLGEPVAHSLSPALHNAAFAALGIDAHYDAQLVTHEELPSVVRTLRAADCLGANVTAPHKQAVIPLVDEVGDEVRALGALNTIVNVGGRLVAGDADAAGWRTLDAPLTD